MTVRFIPLLLASLLAACGGKSVRIDGADDGGTSQGGSATSGGGATSGGSVSSGGGSKGGVAGACDVAQYADGMAAAILVRLTNGSAQPIYLGPQQPGCGVGPLFEVDDSNGRRLTAPGYCESTCEQQFAGNVPGCAPLPCIISSVLELETGESFTQMWSGLYTTAAKLPPECSEQLGATSCTQIHDVTPGAYVFSAQAGRSLRCAQPQAPCDSCLQQSDGTCLTTNALIDGLLLQTRAEVTLDASYGLGDANGEGVRAVDLIFHD